MVLLSFARLYGISSGLRVPGPVTKKATFGIACLILLIFCASVTIAIVPLLPHLEDRFVNGMYYDPKHRLFIGFMWLYVEIFSIFSAKSMIADSPSPTHIASNTPSSIT